MVNCQCSSYSFVLCVVGNQSLLVALASGPACTEQLTRRWLIVRWGGYVECWMQLNGGGEYLLLVHYKSSWYVHALVCLATWYSCIDHGQQCAWTWRLWENSGSTYPSIQCFAKFNICGWYVKVLTRWAVAGSIQLTLSSMWGWIYGGTSNERINELMFWPLCIGSQQLGSPATGYCFKLLKQIWIGLQCIEDWWAVFLMYVPCWVCTCLIM